jgi:spore coat protein A
LFILNSSIPLIESGFVPTRREFLHLASLTGAALLVDVANVAASVRSYPRALDPARLEPFVDPLPLPPISRPIDMRSSPQRSSRRVPFYRIEMREFFGKLHRDLPPTRQWGYGGVVPGPTFETRSGSGVLVEWANRLPTHHFLPIDHMLHGAERSNPDVRAVVHLPGGRTPPGSNGYPEDWYPPDKSVTYFYPNEQDATTLWYHDHAMGINRLNSYAGLIGLFIVHDQFEDELNLPRASYEIPLVIFDRMLDTHGQLLYPVSDNPRSPWVADFFDNIMLVNGMILPYLEVEPRRYRFRILNGPNSRLYHLLLNNGLPLMQIGTDQGLLPAPVEVTRLALAPAERVDVVIDFAGHQGEHIELKDGTVGVMQFRVARAKVQDTSSLPGILRPVPRLIEANAAGTRMLTLDEYDDRTGKTILMLLNKTYWHQPITEKPVINTTEI